MKQNNQKFISVGDYCEYTIKQSSIIEMKEEFTLLTEEGEIVLDVTISADFEEIPEKYREIFINMLTTKYMNRVTLTSNLFSKYSEPEKRNLFQKIKKLFKK
jgi:hypothetical protein